MRKSKYKRYYAAATRWPWYEDSALTGWRKSIRMAIKDVVKYYGKSGLDNILIYEVDIRPVSSYRARQLFVEKKSR